MLPSGPPGPLHSITNDEATTEQDGRLIDTVVLVTEGADTTSVHNQGGLGEGLPDPADGEGAQDMAVADDHDIAGDAGLLGLADDGPVVLVADLGDQVVDARDDVLGALAAGTPVAPDVPGAQALRFPARPDLR